MSHPWARALATAAVCAAGDDLITTTHDGDWLEGGAGNDTLAAGDDDDQISDGPGNDKIVGDDGNDMITLGAGDDTVYAEAGGNRVLATVDGSPDIIYCGPGPADVLTYTGSIDPLDVTNGCETVDVVTQS